MTPFPALLTHFQNISFTNGETPAAVNEASIGAKKVARNLHFFFNLIFTVSLIH